MQQMRSIVTVPTKKKGRMPQWAKLFALYIEILRQTGILEEIKERLKVYRHGGYAAIDAFLFILAYFCYQGKGGLKEFSKVSAPFGPRLAAMAGRKQWPTSSSISRLLSSATLEFIEPFVLWLLAQSFEVKPLIELQGTSFTDSRGVKWHHFDFDPIVKAIRQRALPQSEDLPTPYRYGDRIGASGYLGRKRGEVQYSRAVTQHAGTGLWLYQGLQPGNGENKVEIAQSAEVVRNFCLKNGIDTEKVAIRYDGGIGGVAPLWECVDRKLGYNTRIARYELLEERHIADHLKRAMWQKVVDSESGPQREATDLGQIILTCRRNSTRANGQKCQPLETRVVISRFMPKKGKKHGAGILMEDQYQYEMFANSYPYGSWSAADCVTDYFARCGQENRFGQSLKELHLDYVFNYNPAGQLLATTIGLFLWNLQTLAGANLLEALPDPIEASPQKSKTDVKFQSSERSEEKEKEEHNQKRRTRHSKSLKTQSLNEEELKLQSILEKADLSEKLDRLPKFSWDQKTMKFRCPEGNYLHFHSMRFLPSGSVNISFRGYEQECRNCLSRNDCTKSKRPNFQKEVPLTVKNSDFAHAQDFDTLVTLVNNKVDSSQSQTEKEPKAQQPLQSRWTPPTIPEQIPRHPINTFLIPSVFRHAFTDLRFEVMDLHISITGQLTQPKLPIYLAGSPAIRQHRRKTWDQLLAWNSLPNTANVKVNFVTTKRLSIFLGSLTRDRSPTRGKAA